jgi:hypothetical protein
MTVRSTTAVFVVAAAVALAAATAGAASPRLHFNVFVQSGHNLASVLWDGSRFLFIENTENVVWSAPAAGTPFTRFASMPRLVEETRCVLSPGVHGFTSGDVYCASPDHKIYEITGDGSSVTVLATLPVKYPPASDGALAFDDVGHFGFQLLAATGRSGNARPAGGRVFTISPSGAVRSVGSYPGPGGADELLIAPKGFGSTAGDALLGVDPGAKGGALVAMDPHGRVRTIAKLSTGPNPMAVVPPQAASTTDPAPGLYVTDDITKNVYFASLDQFSAYAGDLLVGSELGGRWWAVRPHGRTYTSIELRSNLGGKDDLEGATFVR